MCVWRKKYHYELFSYLLVLIQYSEVIYYPGKAQIKTRQKVALNNKHHKLTNPKHDIQKTVVQFPILTINSYLLNRTGENTISFIFQPTHIAWMHQSLHTWRIKVRKWIKIDLKTFELSLFIYFIYYWQTTYETIFFLHWITIIDHLLIIIFKLS